MPKRHGLQPCPLRAALPYVVLNPNNMCGERLKGWTEGRQGSLLIGRNCVRPFLGCGQSGPICNGHTSGRALGLIMLPPSSMNGPRSLLDVLFKSPNFR